MAGGCKCCQSLGTVSAVAATSPGAPLTMPYASNCPQPDCVQGIAPTRACARNCPQQDLVQPCLKAAMTCGCICMQAQIVQILLDALKLEHALSLPPVLHLLSCLARDLQQDFLPYIPRLLASITQLVDSGEQALPTTASWQQLRQRRTGSWQPACGTSHLHVTAVDSFSTCLVLLIHVLEQCSTSS